MHGITGSGSSFLSKQFGGNIFSKCQLLDATTYFIILTNDLGHGKFSTPSNISKMAFPKYNYE